MFGTQEYRTERYAGQGLECRRVLVGAAVTIGLVEIGGADLLGQSRRIDRGVAKATGVAPNERGWPQNSQRRAGNLDAMLST